jgi:hypothetical protein
VGAPAGLDDFLSGESGTVAGIRARSSALVADTAAELLTLRRNRRLRRALDSAPARRVLVLAVERELGPSLVELARAELEDSRHEVLVARTAVGGRGRFENLNRLLEEHPAAGNDWLLTLDDDVRLPHRFLDTFLFLAERFGLSIAQPAHRRRSHAAWAVTRRRWDCVARETAFVEQGPVCAYAAATFETILPFPALRAGWGFDNHISAVAAARGWRIGVIDAVAVDHSLRPVAAGYDASQAVLEARSFLAERPYVPASEAQRTLVCHRSWA